MRLDDLTIVLRPRSTWEATDLGIALVRQHARRIWGAWFVVTLPVFGLLNALAWWIGKPWLALLAMWWLKPAFDRIVLFVLSRAVFGATPSHRETVRAQAAWGWRGIAPWLLWRRLHPGRAMLLSVDLLEGLTGARRADRVRVLSRAQSGTNVLLLLIGLHLEAVLYFSFISLVLMSVPIDFLGDSAKAMWETMFQSPPPWAQVTSNALTWLATTIVEPFFVGAGFGLYLNRRTQLEAWDIELAFRRLAQRLAPPVMACLVAIGLALAMVGDARATARDDRVHGDAAPRAQAKTARTPTLPGMMGRAWDGDGAAFDAAVKKAYENTDLAPKETVTEWKSRDAAPREAARSPSGVGRVIATIFSVIAKSGLWILLGVLVFIIVRTRHLWLPWFGEHAPGVRAAEAIAVGAIGGQAPLPDDIAGAARALWQRGERRAALALLYRGAVARLVVALGRPLPAGATEADCLRQARRLDDAAATRGFTRIVRTWQAAAYADRYPAQDEFDALLRDWDAPPREVAP